MLIQLAFFAGGLVALVVGAELLVRGASRIATSFGVSPLVIGLTIVAYGTSAPEMAVSIQSAQSGQVDITLGNVVGSNIFNVLFILGASALVAPLVVNAQLIRQEVPVMVGASLLLWALAADSGLGRGDGALLAALAVLYTAFLVIQSRRATRATKEEFKDEFAPTDGWDRHWGVQLTLVMVGLGLLVLGADWVVDAAVAFAKAFGVSELVIGLTIVAAGTSLPEVATSIMATLRGERDIAVGNVVGSNTFNILAVLGFSSLAAPKELAVAPAILAFDLPVMTAVAVACLPVFVTGRRIARWEGVVFLFYYASFTAYLILAAQHHDALPAFSNAMLWFVIPLTVITGSIGVWRDWQRPRARARRKKA
jgi:cation:H+ antiporter